MLKAHRQMHTAHGTQAQAQNEQKHEEMCVYDEPSFDNEQFSPT